MGAAAPALVARASHRLSHGANGMLNYVWFSVFLAWFIKKIIMRFGGVALYRRSQMFFFRADLRAGFVQWNLVGHRLLHRKSGELHFWA